MSPRAEWMTTSRWSVSHLIVAGTDYFSDFNVTTYASTACGRNANKGRLEPEPTGIDTKKRCPRCRVHAGQYETGGAS